MQGVRRCLHLPARQAAPSMDDAKSAAVKNTASASMAGTGIYAKSAAAKGSASTVTNAAIAKSA
eukprot:3338637-Prymnesium_polylepis.1